MLVSLSLSLPTVGDGVFFSSRELALRYVRLYRQPLGNRGLDTFPRRVHLHHGWIMDPFKAEF